MGQVLLPVGGIRNVLAMSAPLERRVLTIQVPTLPAGNQWVDVTTVISGNVWLLGVRVWLNLSNAAGAACAFGVRRTTREALTYAQFVFEPDDILEVKQQGATALIAWLVTDMYFEWTLARLYTGESKRFAFMLDNQGSTSIVGYCSFEIAEV